jgi:hypothetical protein
MSDEPSIDTVEGKRWILAARCAQTRLLIELLLPDTGELVERDLLVQVGEACDRLLDHAHEHDWSNEEGE